MIPLSKMLTLSDASRNMLESQRIASVADLHRRLQSKADKQQLAQMLKLGRNETALIFAETQLLLSSPPPESITPDHVGLGHF